MEEYFKKFRENTIGIDAEIETPFGRKPLIYSDWTASGRLYRPIEEYLMNEIGPFVANTHTESSYTGSYMTKLYLDSKTIIKKHVNASPKDAIIYCGSGMTGAINKLQRILGLRVPASAKGYYEIKMAEPEDRPVVFISHMEHHSNQTTWLETIADVVVVEHLDAGTMDLEHLERELKAHENRPMRIVSITAASNVTGITTPIHEVAKLAHNYGAYFFADYACSGPYVEIDMHPGDNADIDVVFLSPHKFLGGPGTPGIAIFNTDLYHSKVPDNPGGGTVLYTNPWSEHEYYEDIEVREDGGTPPFLQGIKAGMAVKLKDEMGPTKILEREKEICRKVVNRFKQMEKVKLLGNKFDQRLGVFSYYVPGMHYNLGVQLLNDLYGIQVRGGCACAGTYGHVLLQIDYDTSHEYLLNILNGQLYKRPGWIRMSIHPIMTDDEIDYIMDAIEEVSKTYEKYENMYTMDKSKAIFCHRHYAAGTVNDEMNRILEEGSKMF